MLKRIVTCACAALLAVLPCVSSVSASAESTDYELVNSSFDALVENYGIANLDTSGSQVCYFAGYSADGSTYCSTLWIDSTYYRYRLTNGNADYYTATADSSYPILLSYPGYSYCGHLSVAPFFADLSSQSSTSGKYQLIYCIVNDSVKVESIQTSIESFVGDRSTEITVNYYSGSGTVSDMAADSAEQNSPQDATEPTTEDSGFQLPQEWIDGGETLQDPTVETFLEVNEEEALEVLETLSFDEITNNTGLMAGIGFIWAMVQAFLESFQLTAISVVCLLIIVLAWAFGR